MVEPKEIRTKNTVFRLQENGIIESNLVTKGLMRYELDEVKEMVAGMKELCSDQAYPIVAILEDVLITNEGRKHILDNIHVSMAAMVGKTFVARMMGNFLIKFKPLPIPVKLFSDRDKAYAWVQENLARRLEEKSSTITMF